MADNGKEINFTFKVDQQSLQQVTNAIQNVTKAFAQMNAAMSGGTGSGNVPGIGGSGGGGQKIPQGGGMSSLGAGGGANKTIAQSFLDTIRIVKDLGKVSKDSLSILKQTSKEAADEQARALDSQISKVNALRQAYDNLNNKIKSGGPGSAAAAAALPGVSQELTEGIAQQENARAEQKRIMDFQKSQSGFGKFMSAGNSFAAGVGTIMPMAMAVMAGARQAGQEIMIDPTRENSALDRRQKAYAPARNATISGDLSYLYAMKSLNGQQRADILDRGTALGTRAAQVASELGLNPSDMSSNMNDAAFVSKMAETNMAIVEQNRKENLLQTEALGRLSTEYRPRMSQMRQLGFSKYKTKTGDNKTFIDFLDEQTGQGAWEHSEFLAAQGAIAGASSRGIGSALGSLGMRAAAGGLNINQLLGSLAVSGGAAGSRNLAESAFGATSNNMAIQTLLSAVNQGLYSGGFMTGGAGAMGAMSSMAFGGGDANDMLRAAFAQKGMDATSSFYQGKTDNYQKGRNTLAAIHALGPGASSYAVDFVANKLSANEIADMMESGRVPEQLQRMLGMNNKDALGAIKAYQGEVSVSAMERFVDPRSALYGMSKDISSAGGIKQYIKQNTKGLKGKDLLNEKRRIVEDYGSILAQTDKGLDIQTATSRAYIEAGMGSSERRKGGPGDAAKGTKEEELAKGIRKSEIENYEKVLETLDKDIKGMSAAISTVNKVMTTSMTNLGVSAESTAIDILTLGEAAAIATGNMGTDFDKQRRKIADSIRTKIQEEKAKNPSQSIPEIKPAPSGTGRTDVG